MMKNLKRSAGILMHITSLHGKYGIGDLGHEAYEFADFLEKSGQHYWQLLPLTQPDKNGSYSPYSAVSAFAGNVLLISPDLLFNEGLILEPKSTIRWLSRKKVDFEGSEKFKLSILHEAYQFFISNKPDTLETAFNNFCESEKYWLNDYVLFITIRELFGFQPWNLWPDPIKFRENTALDEIKTNFSEQLQLKKFQQFLFFRQYHALKEYCKIKNILIFGDVPIYIGYDSADVWAHPELFKLDEKLEMKVVAGVPPDYFNNNGQRWGMPVFDWAKVEKTFYGWWVERLKKNLELYDLIRLDHFRGFSAYWEINASEPTAKRGHWVEGPGNNLFDTLKFVFPEMPFVAEDLGEIDQPVYQLRDRYDLPGMRVLQFTFGDDCNISVHSPHNFNCNSIAYSGTHDNNTVKGWFLNETGLIVRKNLTKYCGRWINRWNCTWAIITMCYASVSKNAMVPMQDILKLGGKARMNVPSVASGNWGWRMTRNQFRSAQYRKLRKLVEITHRLTIH